MLTSSICATSKVPATADFLTERAEALRQSRKLAPAKQAQNRQAQYANQHRRAQKFQVGDVVLLSAKNRTFPGTVRKLADRWIGPLCNHTGGRPGSLSISAATKLQDPRHVPHIGQCCVFFVHNCRSSRHPTLVMENLSMKWKQSYNIASIEVSCNFRCFGRATLALMQPVSPSLMCCMQRNW